MANKNLHAAKAAKNDEFYTQMPDIEKELFHYWKHFKGKTVLCNCDDPYESNFFKYFALHFNQLELRKLIATCYDGSPITGNELPLVFELENNITPKKTAYKVEITEVRDLNGDGATDLSDVRYLLQNGKNVLQPLKGNGDFRSPECIRLLREADIVVTNPPFSLFREYVAQLVQYNKKFLIIGNMNAITYKEVFPLIKNNQIWLGFNPVKQFMQVDKTLKSFGNILWFTNLDHSLRHEPLILYKQYNAGEYPKYDNYNAIEVSKVTEIPIDYDGIMGVPITFLGKYCPEQFEIIWQASGNTRASAPKNILQDLQYHIHKEDRGGCTVVQNKRTYGRIFIRRK